MSRLWTPEPGKVWTPPRDVLIAIRDEKRDRLERDYRFIYDQLTGGLRPRGDWLDLLIAEITRWAAPAVVKTGTRASKTGGSAGTFAATVGTVSVGNYVVFGLAMNEAIGSFTHAQPTGYSTAFSNPTNGSQIYRPVAAMWYIVAASAGTVTCTVTMPSGDNYGYLQGIELSGVVGLDSGATIGTDNANGTATSNTITSPSGTSVADSIILAINTAEAGNGGTGAHSTPASINGSTSGVTSLGTNASDSTVIAYDFSRKIITATTTPTAGWSWTGASRWSGGIGVFSGAGGGGGSSAFADYYYRMMRAS